MLMGTSSESSERSVDATSLTEIRRAGVAALRGAKLTGTLFPVGNLFGKCDSSAINTPRREMPRLPGYMNVRSLLTELQFGCESTAFETLA